MTKFHDKVQDVQKSGRLKAFKYVKRDHVGEVYEVLCKVCGIPLQSMRNGVLRPLPAYTTILLEFADGSAHATPLCRECCAQANSQMLQDCYMADLAAWQEEGDDGIEQAERRGSRELTGAVRRRAE